MKLGVHGNLKWQAWCVAKLERIEAPRSSDLHGCRQMLLERDLNLNAAVRWRIAEASREGAYERLAEVRRVGKGCKRRGKGLAYVGDPKHASLPVGLDFVRVLLLGRFQYSTFAKRDGGTVDCDLACDSSKLKL